MLLGFAADLRTKAKRALKAVGGKCTLLAAMQALLPSAPLPILITYLTQFEAVRACASCRWVLAHVLL